MKIFSAEQIKKWDAFTIKHEPIGSINLMERAATACYNWIVQNRFTKNHFRIFCGKGNNGGDGLALARLLIQYNYRVTVYILETGSEGSGDFKQNLENAQDYNTEIHFIHPPGPFPVIKNDDLIIDAIFGTGLNKPLDGTVSELTNHINHSGALIISIDIPTGLFADKSSKGCPVIKANHTLSFQKNKLAFLLPENEYTVGAVHILNIGLHEAFEKEEATVFEMIDTAFIKGIYKPRSAFAHKGTFGHAALLCGSAGMNGAAVLSARACLRSGVGKLTVYIPRDGYEILQTAVPEAMGYVSGEDHLGSATRIETFDSVGIGPGIGLYPSHKELLTEVFDKVIKPMVIDADALNTIAENKSLLKSIPAYSVLTPHPKEFEKLFGSASDDFERLTLAMQMSGEYRIYIVLKGHYSFISTPEGKGFFNSTGNAGMATAGSGDVLTGIITGLMAQGYTALLAAQLGVFIHGLAGDLAAEKGCKEAMIAGDLISCLADAFTQINA